MRSDSAGRTRLPALDGLRALAVLAVILYHFKTQPYVPGGLFGVDIFFVLSGFLITSMLAREWNEGAAISMRRFYLRRVLRIAPAAFTFATIYLGFVLLFAGQPMVFGLSANQAWANFAYFLTQFYSWGIALDKLPGSAFSHLWSLSVEEQYYLVWPALLYGLLRSGVRVPVVMMLTASLIVLSAAVPFFMGEPKFYDVYFRADYRAHSLLAGSLAGLVYAAGYLRAGHARNMFFRLAIVASVCYLIYVLFVLEQPEMWQRYTWAMPLITVAAVFVVTGAAFVQEGLWLTLLANPVIAYVGRRSYAIYLWHFPIGLAMHAYTVEAQLLFGGALTLAAAELSYRVVERPALRLRDRLAGGRETPAPATTLRPFDSAAIHAPVRAGAD